MGQNGLTVITNIKPEEVNALEAQLEKIGRDIKGDPVICFSKITSIHFACWVIMPPDPRFPRTLVLETNYDGDLDAHLTQLIAVAGEGLDTIYAHCEGYPAEGAKNPTLIKQYLKAHSVPNIAFYIGCPGLTVGSVKNAIAVRESVETFLDTEQKNLLSLSPQQVYDRILQHLQKPDSPRPEPSPETLPQLQARSMRNLGFLLLIGIPVALLLSPLLLIWFLLLRMHEIRDNKIPPKHLPIDPRLFEKEDYLAQNHLTTLVNVKPGFFRKATLKSVLWLVGIVARTFCIAGNLGGIPTIHFARWILMDNDTRLLFFSNYDGSWASYLGDFVDKANYGLTAIWGNTESFPPSNYLAFGGAQHIEAFKQWSREHNVYAAVWYSAYPHETLMNLQEDIQIRDTVGKPLSEAECVTFLRRF